MWVVGVGVQNPCALGPDTDETKMCLRAAFEVHPIWVKDISSARFWSLVVPGVFCAQETYTPIRFAQKL